MQPHYHCFPPIRLGPAHDLGFIRTNRWEIPSNLPLVSCLTLVVDLQSVVGYPIDSHKNRPNDKSDQPYQNLPAKLTKCRHYLRNLKLHHPSSAIKKTQNRSIREAIAKGWFWSRQLWWVEEKLPRYLVQLHILHRQSHHHGSIANKRY